MRDHTSESVFMIGRHSARFEKVSAECLDRAWESERPFAYVSLDSSGNLCDIAIIGGASMELRMWALWHTLPVNARKARFVGGK